MSDSDPRDGDTLITRVVTLLRAELRELTRVQASRRPWELPLAAAMASGIPLLLGTAFGRLDLGLVGSLGGMVFLSVPDTPMWHRMVLMLSVSFAMVSCYALGALTQAFPAAMIIALTLITLVAELTARYYRLAPPGILFPAMAASIAAYTPASIEQILSRIGLVALGALGAVVVAFAYSLHRLRRAEPAGTVQAPGTELLRVVVVDSAIVAGSVGLSLVAAEVLRLERPYWVPVSCLAVIQGASLRLVWNRHAQRLLGTVFGLVLAWALLSLPLGAWGVVAVMIALSFVIETLVVRHYGLAVVFITPLTIFLAEATQLGQQSAWATMQARALDIAIGSTIGLAGGAALHMPGLRARVARLIRVLARRA